MADIRAEFASPKTSGNPYTSREIAERFSALLDMLDGALRDGREKDLVILKLQEAHFFAQISEINPVGAGKWP